mmetsp:Transcript_8590/g.25707  ORF Transcript_8590/g.25707 Transcript_8590/m.25707 type:complete len:213 (+) Transcript_8590:742-1380(+)
MSTSGVFRGEPISPPLAARSSAECPPPMCHRTRSGAAAAVPWARGGTGDSSGAGPLGFSARRQSWLNDFCRMDDTRSTSAHVGAEYLTRRCRSRSPRSVSRSPTRMQSATTTITSSSVKLTRLSAEPAGQSASSGHTCGCSDPPRQNEPRGHSTGSARVGQKLPSGHATTVPVPGHSVTLSTFRPIEHGVELLMYDRGAGQVWPSRQPIMHA